MTQSDHTQKTTVIVTGATGYIGSRTAIALAEQAYNVIAVDCIPPEKRDITFPDPVSFRQADLANPIAAREALAGADIVLHFAADIGPLTYMEEHQADILTNNMRIDAAVFPALVDNNIRAVMYSGSSMAFQHAKTFPYRESDIADTPPPSNVYGFSKVAGEYFCRSFARQYDLDYVIVRFHNVYGPGEDSKGSGPGDIHVIPALIEKVLDGKYPVPLLGGAKATRPFTYIDDAVTALVLLTERMCAGDSRVLNTDFNIGPSDATQIIELARLIWELLGDGRPFAFVEKPSHANTSVRREMDDEKIRTIVGWHPAMGLAEGITKTAEWIKARRDDKDTMEKV